MEHHGTILIWSFALVSNHPPRLRCAWMFQCDKIEDLERWICCWRWHWLETMLTSQSPFFFKCRLSRNHRFTRVAVLFNLYHTFFRSTYYLIAVFADSFNQPFPWFNTICFCPASMIKLRRRDWLAPSHHMHFWFQRVMKKEGYRNAKKIQKERTMIWYYFTRILLSYLFGGCREPRFFTTILGTWC